MSWSLAVLSCMALMHLFCSNVMSQQPDLPKQGIVNGALEFSAKLNQLLYKKAQQGGNVLFSPINIYSALALVHLGADGNTRDEIANLLGLPTDSSKIQQTHEILSQILGTIENTTEVEVYSSVSNGWEKVKSANIIIANGIFVQKGVNLVQSYSSQVQSYYKGEVSSVDFAKESDKATDTVNQFVSKSTNGRIPKLFSSPISKDTLALIAASLYFKAGWDEPFYEGSTKEENFNTGSGNLVTKMMTQREYVSYINLPELQLEAISLAYTGNDVSMYFVLPNSNHTLDKVIPLLNGVTLQRIIKQSKPAYVDYKIPQMKYKWSSDINNLLTELGIKDLFTSRAKLNNMVNDFALQVSQVTHAAEIELNEKGTEASAVTVIRAVLTSAKQYPQPIPFHVNRPFVFFIYHHKTETILFLGAVHNPSG